MATETASSIRNFCESCFFRLSYLSIYGAVGAFLIYLPLFFKQVGLNAAQVGILIGIRPFVQLIGSPLAGILADKYKIRKAITVISLLIFMAKPVGFLIMKHPHQTCTKTRQNTTNSSFMDINSTNMLAKENHQNDYPKSIIIEDHWEKSLYFGYALLIMIITELFGGSLDSLIDSAIVESLGENRNDFGKFRLWGSLGIGSSAFLTGSIIHISVYYYCETIQKKYYLMFYVMIGFAALGMLPLLFTKHIYSEDTKENSELNFCSKFKALFCTIKNATFWVTTLSLAMLDGFQMDFGPWFMDDLNTSSVIIGIATALHFFINGLTFVLSSYIINKLGYMPVLFLGLFGNVVVYLLFSFAKSSWLAVVLYVFIGFVPSLTFACGVSFVAMVTSPLGIVSTGEGIFHGLYGIGISFGTIMGGIVTKILGIRTFQVLAGLSGFNLVLMILILYIDQQLSAKEDVAYSPIKTDE